MIMRSVYLFSFDPVADHWYANRRRKFRSLTSDNMDSWIEKQVEKSSQKKEVTGVRKSEERRYTGAKR